MDDSRIRPEADVETDPSRSKKRRGPSGLNTDCCRTCRARKVRCSGNNGGRPCSNCARLELQCSFANPTAEDAEIRRTTPSRSHTEAGTLRKRAQRACKQCHDHKTKCSGDLPRCKRCQANNLQCEYTPAKRRFATGPFQPNSPESRESSQFDEEAVVGSQNPNLLLDYGSNVRTENVFIPRDVVLRHADAFFRHLYPLPVFGFFHPSITREEIEDGRMSPIEAAALCSVSAWFLAPGSDEAREFAEKCHGQVELYLHKNKGLINQQNLLLYVLETFYCWMAGHHGKVWMNVAAAARLVTSLQLNSDADSNADTGEFYQQEIARRLTWQVYNLDRLLCAGHGEYILLPESAMFLRLPCLERSFRENRRVAMPTMDQYLTQTVSGGEDISLHGCLLKLVALRHQVLTITGRFSAPAADRPRPEPSVIMEEVARLHTELARCREMLPEAVQLSDRSIRLVWSSTERPAFIMLHTHLYQLFINLYSFSVPDQPEEASAELLRTLPRDFIQKCQKQAVAHAVSQARFWQNLATVMKEDPTTRNQPFLVADFMFVICAAQVVRVLASARRHRLWGELGEHSTAPLLWRNEIVTAEVIDSLAGSTLAIVRPIAELFPMTRSLFDHLLESLREQNPGGVQPSSSSASVSRADSSSGKAPASSSFFTLPGPGSLLGERPTTGNSNNPNGHLPPRLPPVLAAARGLLERPSSSATAHNEDDDDDDTRLASSSRSPPVAAAEYADVMAIDSLTVAHHHPHRGSGKQPAGGNGGGGPVPMLPSVDPALSAPRLDPFGRRALPGGGGAGGVPAGPAAAAGKGRR